MWKYKAFIPKRYISILGENVCLALAAYCFGQHVWTVAVFWTLLLKFITVGILLIIFTVINSDLMFSGTTLSSLWSCSVNTRVKVIVVVGFNKLLFSSQFQFGFSLFPFVLETIKMDRSFPPFWRHYHHKLPVHALLKAMHCTPQLMFFFFFIDSWYAAKIMNQQQ